MAAAEVLIEKVDTLLSGDDGISAEWSSQQLFRREGFLTMLTAFAPTKYRDYGSLPNKLMSITRCPDFRHPVSVAFIKASHIAHRDIDFLLVVADAHAHCLNIFSADGTHWLRKFGGSRNNAPGSFSTPTVVAAGAQPCECWVAEEGNRRLQCIDVCSGECLNLIAVENRLVSPSALTVNPLTGILYVMDDSLRLVFAFDSSTGETLATFGGFDTLLGTSLSLDGIAVMPATNELIIPSGCDQCVYVVSAIDGKLTRRVELQAPHRSFGESLSVAVTPEGLLVVAERMSNRVSVWTMDGKLLHRFGNKGSALGEFNTPVSVAVGPNNVVAVLELGNLRVQLF